MLWRVVHDLLPTGQSLYHILPITSPVCVLCRKEGVQDDKEHTFFSCEFNGETGEAFMRLMSQYLTNITPQKVLSLDFGEVVETLELPLIWMISSYLLSIWEKRKEKKMISVFETRAELEARYNILRETRFINATLTIATMIEHF